MFYGTAVWDPWLIVAQIVCFQCLYYLTLGIFMTILVGTRVSRISLVYFFDYATVTASTVTGWCVIASFILSSLAGAGILLYLIERAKKCLDFSATLYIVHLLICIIYGGWPSSITWWVVNVTGLAVMALLGEYLCIRRELREIPISKFRSRSVSEEKANEDLDEQIPLYRVDNIVTTRAEPAQKSPTNRVVPQAGYYQTPDPPQSIGSRTAISGVVTILIEKNVQLL